MTNHWIDIGNSDCIMVMGSNAAANHPISFKWVTKAMENGATLISVDPRFTQTSARADIYTALRSGSDIAFLGGMIKYILDNDLIQKDYVVNYTNAPLLINKGFKFEDGLFSGYDAKKRSYDKSTWQYQLDSKGIPMKDDTLSDPFCVYQLLKKHYSRYDLDTVSQITGTSKEDLVKVYKAYAATGKVGKAGTIMYAMGWTQHTVGTQVIRTMAINQLLLGNMGVAGGGVNALRGESNVQGSTDHCLLFHILPGYLATPKASQATLEAYNTANTPKTNDPMSANWWGNFPKYSVSLLKSFYGENATKDNDFGYSWLPKLDVGANYSWLTLFDEMYKGKIKGFFSWGQNPACSGANANKVRKALANLDWLVNVNLFDNETGSFWRGPGVDPSKVGTEVFMLPCAASMEKEGSITNSGRWSQWRYKAVNPPGDARPDSEIMNAIYKRLKLLYTVEGDEAVFPDPITKLKWDYGDEKVDTHAVAKEINGYDLTTGKLLPSFGACKDDGTTSSGNWLYCASYTEKGNMAARRNGADPSGIGLYSEWSWCWPVNRRIIYNRASVDINGNPWDKEHPVIQWTGSGWKGDVPDGGWPPMVQQDKTRLAFIMKPEGRARLLGMGLADGPFPEHYEPLECPIEKNPMSSQRINPAIKLWNEPEVGSDMDKAFSCDPRFPFVATTYRVTEHWQTGLMTRNQPWLVELQPQMFVEMSEELAKLKGIKNGEKCMVSSARGEVESVAIVTKRFKPFKIMGQTVHQVGLPWCYGWTAPPNGGDSANLLTPSIGDANTMIPETKAFMVNVEKMG
jgi:formate dehydrogenase major subunit